MGDFPVSFAETHFRDKTRLSCQESIFDIRKLHYDIYVFMEFFSRLGLSENLSDGGTTSRKDK